LSLTDALTSLPNRRAFDQALEREVSRARRHKHFLAIAMLDIDHFKRVNDTYGHEGGDEVLRLFARTAAGALRKGDALYRYGGEEFVAILPHADLPGAAVAAERMIDAVRASQIRLGSATVQVTASAGVACLSTAGGAEALARADAALYEAKRGGRNRVCASPPQP
jgi:diguanylate cyclase (GGDEF)-like protein